MIDTRTEVEVDPAVKTAEEVVENLEAQEKELIKFIDNLPNLDEVDKYWARDKDMPQLVKEDVDIRDIKDKYSFYDNLAEIQAEIFRNVPAGKQEEIRNIIRRVTSKESKGKDRESKLEHVLRIKRTVEAFKEKQINLKFLVQEKVVSGDVHFGVAEILKAEIFAEVEEIFPSRFWRLADQMSPVDFPNFTTSFNFALQETFTQEKSLKEIKKFAGKLKKASSQDAEELLGSFFSQADRKSILQNIKKLKEKDPAKILQSLLNLRAQKEKNQEVAKKSMRSIKTSLLVKKYEVVKTGLVNLKKTLGDNILVALGEPDFETRFKKTQTEEEKKKKKQKEKIKLDKELEERNKEREHGKIEKEKNEEEQKEEEDKKEEPEVVNLSEASESKKMKITFYEKCIEHARAVIQKCGEPGVRVPTDDPKFWGLEGVRNRPAWLRKNGKWEDYVKFNQSDRNMPSKEYAGGFRFRWLDVRTGSNLTAGRAEDGIKYLNRYKESGYAVATLAGAFSIDWKGSSSPVYTPERFIQMVEGELGKLKGTSASKTENPKTT